MNVVSTRTMTAKTQATFYGFIPGKETFETFSNRLDKFFAATKVIDDIERVKFLLSSIGSKTYGTLRTIVRPAKPVSLPYQNLISVLLGHYKANKNEMAERFSFWKRDQQPNESIMDYINELQRLALSCNFQTFLNQSLRDRFVFGLCDKEIQRTLIDTKNLTFKKACAIAQTINIKTCLTKDRLSDTDVTEDDSSEVPVTRRQSNGSKSRRRSSSNGNLSVKSPSNLRNKNTDVPIVVKNEPTEDAMSPSSPGDFAFEEINCKGYPSDEADEPIPEPRPETNSQRKTAPNPAPPAVPREKRVAPSKDVVNTNVRRAFACDLCTKSFGSTGNLARHRAAHSGARNFACTQCAKSYTQASSLKAHMSTHDGLRRFRCDLCDRTFIYRSNLRVHLETHGSQRCFQCSICANQYKGRRSLKRHLPSHGADGHAILDEIERESRERRHREPSAPPKPNEQHACADCPRSFALVAALKRHANETHGSARPFACDVCAATFTHKHTLQTHHMAKHTDDRPFVCAVCSKGFVLKMKLKNHMKLHENQRNFICETCGKGFVTNAILKAHLQSHAERTFACEVCAKAFKTKLALAYHARTHTGVTTKRFTCEFCGRQFVHRATLRSHVQKDHMPTDTRERSFKCSLCTSAFFQHSHLKTHMLVHTKERAFACHLCDRAFALRGNLVGHMVVHTGERRFRCDVCPKTFTLRRNLKSHVAKSHGGEVDDRRD